MKTNSINMQKAKIVRIIALLTLCFCAVSQAADKNIPGPKGGKILNTKVAPYAEFFVQPDRTVALNFYGSDMKPVAVAEQSAVVFADAKAGRAKLILEKKGDSLVSKTPLPEGDGYNIVVQYKPTASAKAESFKVAFHDEQCAKCKRAEYACICEDGDKHDHDEKRK